MNNTQKNTTDTPDTNNTTTNTPDTKDISVIKRKNKSIIDNYNKKVKKNNYFLPTTNIINYIDIIINSRFFNKKNESLYYFFNIDKTVLSEEPQQTINISTSFQQNQSPDINLDVLIGYSALYVRDVWFIKENDDFKLNVNKIKFQASIDIPRTKIFINGKNINTIRGFEKRTDVELSDVDRIKYVDNVNRYIMNLTNKADKEINMDNIVKIDILTCQNMFNFILRCITNIITKKFIPYSCFMAGRDKSTNINITNNIQNVILKFKADIGLMETTEYIGNLSYELKMDLNTNTFEFTNFTLKYDIPSIVEEEPIIANRDTDTDTSGNTNANKNNIASGKTNKIKQSVSNFVNNNKAEVLAGTSTTGVVGLGVGSLFLAGLLGGTQKAHKKIYRRFKKNKTRRINNSNKKGYKNK